MNTDTQNGTKLHPATFNDYKFNILERLFRYKASYKRKFIEQVAASTGRSQSGVKRIIYMKSYETATVDYNILDTIAAKFNVSIEELKNNL